MESLLGFLVSSGLRGPAMPPLDAVINTYRKRQAAEAELPAADAAAELLGQGPLGRELRNIIDAEMIPWWRSTFQDAVLSMNSRKGKEVGATIRKPGEEFGIPCMREMEQGARLSFAVHYVPKERRERAVQLQVKAERKVLRCMSKPENKQFWT